MYSSKYLQSCNTIQPSRTIRTVAKDWERQQLTVERKMRNDCLEKRTQEKDIVIVTLGVLLVHTI